MKMSRNLNQQLKYVINASYYGDESIGRKGGFKSSKHVDKINDTKSGKIYSFNHKQNVESIGKEFSSFMKEYHPDFISVQFISSQIQNSQDHQKDHDKKPCLR